MKLKGERVNFLPFVVFASLQAGDRFCDIIRELSDRTDVNISIVRSPSSHESWFQNKVLVLALPYEGVPFREILFTDLCFVTNF